MQGIITDNLKTFLVELQIDIEKNDIMYAVTQKSSAPKVLLEINGAPTLGRPRDELMPLLKLRPLELRVLPPESDR